MKNIRILVKGLMDHNWEDWYSGFSLAHTPAGETIFSGPIRSQAELRGLVTRIADLGVEIISLETAPFNHRAKQRAEGTVTGSGETGTKNKPPRGRNKETHKEDTMKKKRYLVPAALVLVITSVITGIVYSGSGDAEPTTVLAVEKPVPAVDREWTADQVKALYGYTEPKAVEPLTVDQIKALYGYTEPNTAPVPVTVDQIKGPYGYTEPKAGPDQMSIDQIKALYGYVDEPVVKATAGLTLAPLTVAQIQAIYGYAEEPAAPRIIPVDPRPAPEPLTAVEQLKALYGWTDAGEVAAVNPGITLAPLTADQIKALYGWTDEPPVTRPSSESAGSDELTVDQIKALYGYVEGPELNIWDLEIVPPIYTYPWYIRP